MRQISDFIVPCNILKSICRARHTSFVDLPVIIDQEQPFGLRNGSLCVGESPHIGFTYYKIVSLYLKYFNDICDIPGFQTDEQKVNTLTLSFAHIRGLMTNDELLPGAVPIEPVAMRLYSQPLIWIIMKDIICPVYSEQPINLKIVACQSSYYDTRFWEIGDPDSPGCEEDTIFWNTGIEDLACSQAMLLLAAIDGHRLNAREVVSDLLESVLADKLIGAARLSFKDDTAVDDFIAYLSSYSGSKHMYDKFMAKTSSSFGKMMKTAQFGLDSDMLSGTWWFMGLIEKMLEPSRGADWSTYKRLSPFYEELMKKIEAARKKKGRAGLSYEALLRIKDGEIDPEKIAILEKELSSDRIWQD